MSGCLQRMLKYFYNLLPPFAYTVHPLPFKVKHWVFDVLRPLLFGVDG